MKKNKQTIQIAGEKFQADAEFVPLLKELNKVGLKTTQHCCGHNEGLAYISIDMRKVEDVGIRMIDGYPRLVIWWDRSKKEKK